ncbi:MAG: IS481 family transposase [Gemmatimonadota bacterium]
MPWRTQTIMDERARFVFEAERSNLPFAELCRRYGISRPTGYKWVDRRRDDGVVGLEDRSHRPHSCPHATPPQIEKRIIELRKRRRWGAPKLRTLLAREFDSVPSISTIHRILERHDLVRRRKPRRHSERPGRTPFVADRPNALWTADFKGQFRTQDGELCYPLTVQDAYSRFLLDCRGLLRPTIDKTMPVFRRLFRTYGVPDRIRTDNGQPFASAVTLGRLSRLSVWWIELGIAPELTQPGKPQQNGRHERMHRTLKREATRPARKHLAAQQTAFNTFRRTFNDVRPHQALDQKTPAACYEPSERSYTPTPLPLTYPAHFEVRLVSSIGGIRWKSRTVWVSELLARCEIGLERIADDLWAVYFGPRHLGWLDESDFRIMKLRRRSTLT